MKKLSYILPLLALWSCEKELDYELPDPGPQIVIDTRLKSGQGMEVFLSESVYSLSSADPKSRDDFEAWLYTDDPSSPFQLTAEAYNPGYEPQFVYRTPHQVNANQNYRLVVRGPGFPEATVSERVPSPVEIDTVTYNRTDKEFTFRFKDNGSTDDYYMITVNELGADDLVYSSLDLALEFFEFQDFIGDSEFDGRQYGFVSYLKDDEFNGKTRELKVRIEGETSAVFVELRLHHISSSYYRHELTKSAYNYSDGFFSEPSQIYSNVENGYGIMATSASSVRRVQF